jgi:hypothetical protein
MRIKKSDKQFNYSHKPTQIKQQVCRNFSLGLATKVRACKGACQKEDWESLMLLGV